VNVEAESGLSVAEAAARLTEEGPNALPGGGRRGWLAIIGDTAREPMFLLLLAAGTLYLVFGELQEGLILFGFVLVTIGLTLYQEGKTERAIEALRDLTSPRALVIRDGQPQRIAGREVVRGDWVMLAEGDRVPADGVLFGMPALLFPMHIAFLELIIDPSCSLAFENEPAEDDVMQRPPRDPEALLFGGATLWMALLQGAGVLAVVIGAYAWADGRLAETEARAFAFTTLVVANLALIYVNRSRSQTLLAAFTTPNPILWIVTGVALGLLALAFYLPFLAGVFRFAPLPPGKLAAAFALGLASVVWFQVLKFYRPATAP